MIGSDSLLATLNSTLSDYENMELDFSIAMEEPAEREKKRQSALDVILGKLNRRITEHTELTVAEFLTEFLKATIKWNIVDKAKNHLLRLIEKIVLKGQGFPTSLDVLKSSLKERKLLTEPKFYTACYVCGNFVDKISKKAHHCINCGSPNYPTVYKNSIGFAYIPISPSIKLGLESGLFKDCSEFSHMRKNDGFIRTFLDGAVCQHLIGLFGENVLFISINSDSGLSTKSSLASKWILQHYVHQPNVKKPLPKMNTLWYKGPVEKKSLEKGGTPAQLLDTLYKNLIDELRTLSTDGLTYTINNVQRNVKVILLSHNMDAIERYQVLGTRHFLGAFGCPHGLVNPPVDPILHRRYYISDENGERCTPRDPEVMKNLVRNYTNFQEKKG